jgi:hypothetical protein
VKRRRQATIPPVLRVTPAGLRSLERTAGKTTKTTVTALYKKFEQAHAKMRQGAHDKVSDKKFARLADKAFGLAREIVGTPAPHLDEMLLKARVVIFCTGWGAYEKLEDLDHWQPERDASDEEIYLASARDDLSRFLGNVLRPHYYGLVPAADNVRSRKRT